MEMVAGLPQKKLQVVGDIPIDDRKDKTASAIEPAYLPATSMRRIACGIENPSNTGTACVTPSPESRTMPVVRPDAYLQEMTVRFYESLTFDTDNDKTACTEVKRAGTLKVSNNI